jgi:dolichol-phosphate mannosyltransferase
MANEAATVTSFVQDCLNELFLYEFKKIKMYIVIDKVSTDGTLDLLKKQAEIHPEIIVVYAPQNRCVVDAYVNGYRAAIADGADWILEIDAGYSHQPSDLPKLINSMKDGYDCVFGSRFVPGGSMTQSGIKRKAVSIGGTVITNFILGTGLKDMTSGFQCFKAEVLVRILNKGIVAKGPFFQTEMKAFAHHLNIVEVPIQYSNPSHAIGNNSIIDAFKSLYRLYKLKKKNDLFLEPIL